MSIKDEDGLQGLTEIETTIRTWTGSSTRHRHGGALGHGGPTGQEPRRNQCVVDRDGPQDEVSEDVTGEEVSEMHVRSRRSCRSSPTTRRRARRQCTLDELKQAPLRRRQPGRHGWQRRPRTAGRKCDAINAMGSQQCSTCKGYGHVPLDCPKGKGKCKGQHNFGKDKGTYGWREVHRQKSNFHRM